MVLVTLVWKIKYLNVYIQAKKIKNKAVVNEDPNAKLVRELKEELEMLRSKYSITQLLLVLDNFSFCIYHSACFLFRRCRYLGSSSST